MQSSTYLSPQASRARRDPGRAPAAAEQRNTADKTYSGNQAALRRFSTMQCKLNVGSVNDPLEAEADRAADRVMRMTDPAMQPAGLRAGCASCAAPVQLFSIGRQANFGVADGAAQEAAVDEAESAISSSGQALDGASRAYFEPRFGRDFSQVRLHTSANAANSARSLQARAYTIGHNIAFAAGEYAPATERGAHLLAHELAHTVQQSTGPGGAIRRKLQVGAGLSMDTKGFTTTKAGDVYTCPAIVKNSVWNELFTALLFSPRVFKIKGTTNAEVNASLEQHMKSRAGIVDFASKKQYSFAAGSGFRMNPAMWEQKPDGTWQPKPGVDMQKASEDLNVHPNEYAIACLAATKLTVIGGGKSPLTNDNGVGDADWIPGDWGYIKNINFPPSGGTPGLEGENLIYTGKDKLWGHFDPGLEYKTLIEWFNQVKSWNGGAAIMSYRTRPTIGLD
jgi:hypothetical protein